MFDLLAVRDTVRVLASVLHADLYNNQSTAKLTQVLRREIRLTYVGRVLAERGLVVGCHCVTKIGEAHLFPGDAAWYYKCEFQLIVYNPKKNDVVHGLILSSFRTELHLSQGFFQDLYVLPERLPVPSDFGADGLWHWNITDPGAPFGLGEVGRWRVVDIVYNVKTPARPVVYKQRRAFKNSTLVNKENDEVAAIRLAIQRRDQADIALASNYDLIGFEPKDDNASTVTLSASAAASAFAQARLASAAGTTVATTGDVVINERLDQLNSGSAKSLLMPDYAKQCEMHISPMVLMVQARDSGLGMAQWW
jgi:DNA-directed RNA polymerase subunit E'/Rpb7